jgi:hypothetical protein
MSADVNIMYGVTYDQDCTCVIGSALECYPMS